MTMTQQQATRPGRAISPESGADTNLAMTLRDDERQPCEVWTRVMGYHRPVASFNVGKQGEHHERRFFAEPARQPESR